MTKFGLRVIGRHNFPVFEVDFPTFEARALYIIKIAPAMKNGDKLELYEKEA